MDADVTGRLDDLSHTLDTILKFMPEYSYTAFMSDRGVPMTLRFSTSQPDKAWCLVSGGESLQWVPIAVAEPPKTA